jgi:SAM-dependent methyltransferase
MSLQSLTVSIEVELEPDEAFQRFFEELSTRLHDSSSDVAMKLEPGVGGRLVQLERTGEGSSAVGTVLVWDSGRRVVLEWRAPEWSGAQPTSLEIEFEAVAGGTRVVLQHRGWFAPFGELLGATSGEAAAPELLGWFADRVAAPFLLAMSATGMGEWLADRIGRRPTGPAARQTYRAPQDRRPSFVATLDALGLTEDDYLLDVGCGGGSFLREALKSGCRGAGVDHSEQMISVTASQNAESIALGRLSVRVAKAEQLPFDDTTFTAVAMTDVLYFLRDPLAVLAECHRVLVREGRLAVYTVSADMAGTSAAPEPIARHMRFHSDEELVELAYRAGFGEASVSRLGGAQLLFAKRR